jgi:hypothetical protein
MGAYKNSAVGDVVAKTAAPGAAAIAKALSKKPAAAPALPTMEQHADALHPVAITPNRVTGNFSGE